MDPTFTDAEKRFVLTEIIKASDLDVGILVELVKYHNIDPAWLSMQVPNGRNLGQCIKVTEALLGRQMQYPNLKRKFEGPYVDIAPKRQLIEPPRPIAIPRNIQPRPSSNGLNPAPSPTITAPPATGKKRGRPSKAEKAEKEAQLRAGHFGVFPNRQGGPGNYHPISAAPAMPSATQLPPISTVSDVHSHSSPAAMYNVVSEPPDNTSARLGRDRGQRKQQTDEKLQEARPSDSNAQRPQALRSEPTDSDCHKDAQPESMLPSQPRQMPSPMEPRQLPSLAESVPPVAPAKRLSVPTEHPGSPMSQHHDNNKPGSHSPHLNPAPAAIVP